MYLMLHPGDCDPPHDLDMTPGSRDWIKVEMLKAAFLKDGFDPTKPALVGYPLNGKVQLLSGTHRWWAAREIGMFLPVRLLLRSVWESKWGTDYGAHAMRDIPVCELQCVDVLQGDPPAGIGERVDLTRDLERE
jgi:hypothetical protein